MSPAAFLLIFVVAAAATIFMPRAGLYAQVRRWRSLRDRMRVEDALKHLLESAHGGRSMSLEALAASLRLRGRRLHATVRRMESAGLVQSVPGGLMLTAEGERLALHVVRAHRLWERYLADEAAMPVGRIHRVADRAEHRLSAEALDVLDAHLGHPQRDPHGDPIPAADGSMIPLDAVALGEWPKETPAQIVHIEDEPEVVFEQIIAAGLHLGMTLRVLESGPERITVSDGQVEHRLSPGVAANIHVAEPETSESQPGDAVTLADLPLLHDAEVVAIDLRCRGFGRRRLLDLGLTPGTRVRMEMIGITGDPRAIRVRGTLIALRREQASLVWVRPVDANDTKVPPAGDARRTA